MDRATAGPRQRSRPTMRWCCSLACRKRKIDYQQHERRVPLPLDGKQQDYRTTRREAGGSDDRHDPADHKAGRGWCWTVDGSGTGEAAYWKGAASSAWSARPNTSTASRCRARSCCGLQPQLLPPAPRMRPRTTRVRSGMSPNDRMQSGPRACPLTLSSAAAGAR